LIHHYLEIVSGIDWKVGLLEKLPLDHVASVLEVGCNVGAFLDYCRLAWGAAVVGLEPSVYGLAGARLLSLPIHQETMADASEIRGRRFDLVLATEVLEHVEAPVEFLRNMRGLTADGGVAVITTPRASSLSPSTSVGELYAALSTGAHRFLTSEAQLRSMVQAAGFAWCHIEPFGMTQLCVMSTHPLDLQTVPHQQARLRRYYSMRAAESTGDRRADLGYKLSHYVAARNDGWPGGESEEHDIENGLRATFEIALDDLGELVREQSGRRGLVAFGRKMPYNLPIYLFWRSHRPDLTEHQRTEMWEASALLAAYGLRADPVNLFVYIDVLERAVPALHERHRGSFGDELRAQIATIPAARHLRITDRVDERVSEVVGAVIARPTRIVLGEQTRRILRRLRVIRRT
jgi:SAM-dependent methyltransferase